MVEKEELREYCRFWKRENSRSNLEDSDSAVEIDNDDQEINYHKDIIIYLIYYHNLIWIFKFNLYSTEPARSGKWEINRIR